MRISLSIAIILCFAVSVNASSLNAKDYGAAGDGVKDDGPAIQRALNEIGEAGGGEVFLPAGRYRINDHIVVPSGVTLRGIWQAPHHSDQAWGSVLHAVGREGEETGPALVQLSPSSTVKGITIYYPNQRLENVKAYPYAIQGRGMNGSVIDVTLVNAYQGIDFGTHHNELHVIRNVFGCCLRRGVYINNCTDIGRIENVHFNPHFWSRAKVEPDARIKNMKELIDYLNNNTEVFIFGRTDWEYVVNTFAFGFDKCYKFIETEQGACNGNFLGIGADGGRYALWVEATQPPGLLITNGEFVTFSHEDSTQVVTTESYKGVVQLNNCSFWGPTDRLANLRGPGSVSFQQCNFVHWNHKGGDKHGIHAENGEVYINNCRFREAKPQIYLGEKVKGAIITGNRFNNEMWIKNKTKAPVEVGLNIEVK